MNSIKEEDLPPVYTNTLFVMCFSSAAKKKHFQMMRKMHYNEGLNIKLARQLIASELEDEEDADEEMRDDTEETEEISVDPPQEGKPTVTNPGCAVALKRTALPALVGSL